MRVLLQVFDPALNNLLLHPDWDTWSRKMLPRYKYPEEASQSAAKAHAAWFAELKAKRAAEAAAKAAEQQAATVHAEATNAQNESTNSAQERLWQAIRLCAAGVAGFFRANNKQKGVP